MSADGAVETLNELLELGAEARGGVLDRQPAAPPEIVFVPLVEHPRDSHQIDIDEAGAVAVFVTIPAHAPAADDALQPGFLFGFTNCGVARAFIVADGALRDDPPLAAGL